MAWQRVAVVVPGDYAEALAEALADAGAVSTDLADAGEGTAGEHAIFAEPGADAAPWPRCRVTALFPSGCDASHALDEAISNSHSPTLEAASLDRLEDANWVAETQRQFAPIHAAQRLWIVPTWHEAPEPEAVNIVLDPGSAFGTGSHPTTRLCLSWLERNVSASDTVLDYGCGSGILGIAALKLGAREATSVDIDPLALEAARYNAERNAVSLRVVAADRALALQARLTIANILARPLCMLAPLLAAHTQIGGRIALAGVLEDQADEVAGAYSSWASLAVESRDEGWVLLSGERHA